METTNTKAIDKIAEMLGLEEMYVRLTFVEEVLGSAPNNKEIHSEFIASKAPDATTREEEVAAVGVDGVEMKEMTVFPRTEDGDPFIWDYQIKGYFKDTCGGLKRIATSKSAKIKAYKKEIDKLVFVKERKNLFNFDGKIGSCQRPLRGQTAQGERIALANSETVASGSSVQFTVLCPKSYFPVIREWFDAGILMGFGQWRNSGKGRFLWEELDVDGKTIGGNLA